MQFYTKKHRHYCGIDLHTKTIYICILDAEGTVLVHKETKAKPASLLKIIKPYLDDLVLCVECMFTWYWVSNFCFTHHIKFVLGHALYMKAIHGGKAKNDKIDSYKIAKLIHGGMLTPAFNYPEKMRSTRDLLRRRLYFARKCAELKAHTKILNHQYNLPPITGNLKYSGIHEEVINRFEDESAQRSARANVETIAFYHTQINSLEFFVKKHAKIDDYQSYMLLKSIHGVGDILSMTILYEVQTIDRFPTVQKFSSYCRLIKCRAESAGKDYGSSGTKIGNAHLRWAFSEAAALFLRGNEKAQRYHQRLVKKHGNGKAMGILSHKIGRAVYYMLKTKEPFNESIFLNG